MESKESRVPGGRARVNGAAAATPFDVADRVRVPAQRATLLRGCLLKLLDATPGMVMVSDVEGRLFYMNAMGRSMLGVSDDADVVGRNVADFYAAGAFDRIVTEAVPTALETGVWRGEAVLCGPDRTDIPVSQVLMAHRFDQASDEEPAVALSSIAWDMREHKRTVARLRHQATHDALTGLPNRMLLLDRLKQALNSARRRGYMVAVLFLDFDDFRQLNEEFGHEAANTVLGEFAYRLNSGLRAEDTVARYGGDEFVLLVRDITTPIELVRSRLMTAIYDALAMPFVVGDAQVCPTVSVGVAVYPDDGGDAGTLLRKADSMMYRVKRHAGTDAAPRRRA